ncbi:MAG: type II toxin-antitoxin system HicB family antitoxin [Steroidobacteraceae bacterium]|jgi:predicted RNase H-like HicB family nuclease|nr:type II toxin-antitoxin system HicB family antitoxin [Steroidobacteraceae bacterium]
MRYPIAIEVADGSHAFGVVVPDLPGCFSAGDTLEEAIANAPEAIALWLSEIIDAGKVAPLPKPIEVHRKRREFKGWVWAVVEVDLSKIADKAERINITLPSRLLKRVDAKAAKSGESRSGFLARAAMEALAER